MQVCDRKRLVQLHRFRRCPVRFAHAGAVDHAQPQVRRRRETKTDLPGPFRGLSALFRANRHVPTLSSSFHAPRASIRALHPISQALFA